MIKKQKMKMKKIGWFFMFKFLMHKYIRSTHFLRMKQVYTEIGSFHFLSKYDKLTYKLKYNYDGFFSSEKTFDCSPEVLHFFKWFWSSLILELSWESCCSKAWAVIWFCDCSLTWMALTPTSAIRTAENFMVKVFLLWFN